MAKVTEFDDDDDVDVSSSPPASIIFKTKEKNYRAQTYGIVLRRKTRLTRYLNIYTIQTSSMAVCSKVSHKHRET